MLKNKGLAFKQCFFILGATAVMFAVVFSYSYFISRKIIKNQVEEQARAIVTATVNKLDQVFFSTIKVPLNIAQFLENNPPQNESELYDYIRAVLKSNPEIFGCCIAYEPNIFKKNFFYFAPYCYRKDNSFECFNLGNETNQYFYQDWYQIPKEIKKAIWTEPYFDEGGGKVMMTTYSIPFYKKVGQDKQFQGVVTADISLTWLEEIVKNIKIFQSGYAFLISNFGTIITHPDPEYKMNETIFTLAEERNDNHLKEIGKSMIKGKS